MLKREALKTWSNDNCGVKVLRSAVQTGSFISWMESWVREGDETYNIA